MTRTLFATAIVLFGAVSATAGGSFADLPLLTFPDPQAPTISTQNAPILPTAPQPGE